MISWGLVSATTAFVVGPNSFYGVRLLLGVMEAGFFPGVTFFLAAWFPAQYRTRMLAWFLVGIPLSSLIGTPVCSMLLQMDGIWGLAGWQWLFLLVSLPCVPLGILTLVLLADRPQTASWLTTEERDTLDGVLASEVRERPHSSLLGGAEGSARPDLHRDPVRIYTRLLRHRHLAALDAEGISPLQYARSAGSRRSPISLPPSA